MNKTAFCSLKKAIYYCFKIVPHDTLLCQLKRKNSAVTSLIEIIDIFLLLFSSPEHEALGVSYCIPSLSAGVCHPSVCWKKYYS